MARRRIEGYWTCSHCGTKGIGGLTKTCPSCGNPQSEGLKFDIKGGPKRYLDSEIAENYGKGADWVCAYCGSYNRYNQVSCRNCGGGKADSEKDYFGNEVTVTPQEDYNSEQYMSTEDDDLQEESYSYEAQQSLSPCKEETSDRVDLSYNPIERYDDKITSFFRSINLKSVLAVLGGAIAFVFIIMFLISIFTPQTYDATISDKSWERNVTIQELITFDESDWEVPVGGRVYDERQEVRDYEEIIVDYEIVEHEVPREEFDHYEYKYYDNGDGTFDEEEIAVYKTVYDIEYEKVPVYDEIPIYDTKYYYKIDRWRYARTEKASGTTDDPYWPQFQLANKERENGKSEVYTINFMANEKAYSKNVSYEEWQSYQLGEKVQITVVAGIVTEVSK